MGFRFLVTNEHMTVEATPTIQKKSIIFLA